MGRHPTLDTDFQAHHLNDNIETMILNLIRGAHINGLKGMTVVSKKTHLLRPMLGITKKEILAYLQKNHLPFCEDSSNQDTDFSRNWIRKNIIPNFSKINPSFEKTFKETLHNLTQTSQYLEQSCADWLKKNAEEFQKEFHIELDTFLQEHLAFQKQLLTHLYTSHHRSTKKLTNKHLNEILETLHLRQANKKKEFGPQTFIEIFSKTVDTSKSRTKKALRYIRLINKK